MDSMENICNFCANEDRIVSEIQNDFTQDPPVLDIAEKHFWFTRDELISFHICGTCRKQLLEFHQFYCQVEMLYSALREDDGIKLEYAPIELNPNHIELESVNLEPVTERTDEERIGIETVDDIEVDSETNHIELTPIDIETETASSTEEKIESETTCGKPKKARRSDDRDLVTDDDIRIFCRLKCHICSEEFDYFKNLQAHCLAEHNQSCYVNCCDCRFDQIWRLQEHILVHIDPNRFQCKLCGKNLNSKRSLLRHQDSVHPSEDAMIYKCTMCPRKYAKLYLLNGHMACHLDRKPSEARPKCPVCLKPMKNESWMEVHMLQTHGTTVQHGSKQ